MQPGILLAISPENHRFGSVTGLSNLIPLPQTGDKNLQTATSNLSPIQNTSTIVFSLSDMINHIMQFLPFKNQATNARLINIKFNISFEQSFRFYDEFESEALRNKCQQDLCSYPKARKALFTLVMRNKNFKFHKSSYNFLQSLISDPYTPNRIKILSMNIQTEKNRQERIQEQRRAQPLPPSITI